MVRRLHMRGERPEYRFLWRDARPQLPVISDGRLILARWGNGRRQSRILPSTGWTWLASLRDGSWTGIDAAEVVIPATYGLDGRGVWFLIQVGIGGLLVPDENGKAVVYVIAEPASHYYEVMTGERRMPVLIGQRI
jgi:hypothetical protein